MQKLADFLKKIVKSQEKFSTFSGKLYALFFLKKICQVIQENVTVFIENVTIFVEKFEGL